MEIGRDVTRKVMHILKSLSGVGIELRWNQLMWIEKWGINLKFSSWIMVLSKGKIISLDLKKKILKALQHFEKKLDCKKILY